MNGQVPTITPSDEGNGEQVVSLQVGNATVLFYVETMEQATFLKQAIVSYVTTTIVECR